MSVHPPHLFSRLRRLGRELIHLPRALGLAWHAARGWTAAWLALLVVQGLLPAGLVYLTRALVDGVVRAVEEGRGWSSFAPVLLVGFALALVMLLAELFRGLAGWIRTAQAERVADDIRGRVHAKAIEVDLAFYDRPDYHDRLHRASSESSARSVALLESVGSLFRSGLTLLAMMAVLLPYGWWIPLALLASTLPAFYVVLRYALRQHAWWAGATSRQRKAWYYDWLITTPDAAAELRLFDLGGHFRQAYQEVRRGLRDEKVALGKSQALAGFGAAVAGLLLAGLTMGWMLWRVVAGAFTLGDLALFFQAFNQGQGMMRTLLQNVAELYRNSLFLGNLFEYLALSPSVTAPADPKPFPAVLKNGVRFAGVTFRYPGEERAVLEDFNLTLPAGRVTAVVGPNGAGKSTLARLLCRLYDPAAGAVTVDGTDLRAFDPAVLRRHITAMFQTPVRYQATAADNILFGDLAADPATAEIRAAAEAAGADEIVARLPEGYDSLLGRWIAEGHELSPGEWRRLALARAFLRNASLLILDEPTSAMDAWAEAEWLDRFLAGVDGRTTLLITHRFTTAMRAHRIHVMDRGRIVESGTHEELAAGNGRYARSWRAQVGERPPASPID